MEKKLKELFNVIMEEMKTNDEFKKRIEVVLGREDKPKKKVKKKQSRNGAADYDVLLDGIMKKMLADG